MALAALLHDAGEYVIGDMISPFKAALGYSYKDFEARLEHAIHLRFGLPPVTPAPVKALIKSADLVSAGLEAVRLAGFSQDEADALFGRPPETLALDISPLPAGEAQARYLQRFRILADAVGGGETDAAFATE